MKQKEHLGVLDVGQSPGATLIIVRNADSTFGLSAPSVGQHGVIIMNIHTALLVEQRQGKR